MSTPTVRVALVAAIALGPAAAAAQPAGVGPETAKLRVAVMDLSGSALRMQTAQTPMAQGGTQTTTTVALPPPPEFARALTEILTTTLVDTRRFVVLERQQGQSVLAEQDFGASQRANQQTAPGQGGMIGAQAMITGDITGYAYTQQALGGNALNLVKGVTASASRLNARVVIDLRLIDATTGEVLASAAGTGNASATGVATDLTKGDRQLGTSGAWSTPLGEASREAITKSVRALIAALPVAPWSARVADVRDAAIYLNAGAEDGVTLGMVLELYERQPPLVDPDTGRNLGAPERLLGEVEVVSVEPRFSVARARSGSGFARGHVVRRAGGK
ncbi:MAG TPA: CsgG/HfaB family protein [Gemmatimonadales bacterium]|nr:CsgG/HfaB family protein [Gemmatimonadales bacterium]